MVFGIDITILLHIMDALIEFIRIYCFKGIITNLTEADIGHNRLE